MFSSVGRALPSRYLTACANDFCREAKRQTISAQDVMQAIKELEFGELEEPLKEYLDMVRAKGWHPSSSAALVWLTSGEAAFGLSVDTRPAGQEERESPWCCAQALFPLVLLFRF